MIQKIINLAILILIFFTDIIFSQYQNVMISNQYFPEEVSIMINPKNINQVVAGSNIYYLSYDSTMSGYYYSTNGGLNWSGERLQSSLAIPSGDPVITVDTAGSFYFIQNARNYVPPLYDRQLVMKSTNGGISWDNGSIYGLAGKFQDKPWGCVDWSNSIWRNNIYITWTEFSTINFTLQDSSVISFTKSTNGGLTWSQPLRISKRKGDGMDSSNTMEGAVPCIGPNGEIYVSWSGPVNLYSNQYAIFFNKSLDGGNTWLDSERVATTQYGGWVQVISGTMRCNGFPVTCCDISNGPYRGNIYINFSDQRNGVTDTDIWLIKSTNGGVNWSLVKRVNNDPPGKQQFFTWMTVDQSTGYLYFIFYDERNLSGLYANVYIARSTDGGETFQNVRINNNTLQLYQNAWIGDYTNISAANGHVRPIWSSTLYNGSIFTAIVDTFYSIGITKIDEKIPSVYSLKQNYPNPFNPKTKIRFDVSKSGDAEIEIFDITGKLISTLVREYLTTGSYNVDFDASNISSGVYFYRLKINNYIGTRKMIVIK